jgi:aryl-alcohol dehydrogenase-like predicted oxidoreductase
LPVTDLSVAPTALPAVGCGLLSIGRDWGVANGIPPSEQETMLFLQGAVDAGVRLFDTAPSYGSSETRFGSFLRSVGKEVSDNLIIATKMGEHWDEEKNAPFVDHTFDKLRLSIDQSLQRLGRIDLLQLHIATLDNVDCDDVLQAIEYAKTGGIDLFGASLKDMRTAQRACHSGAYQTLQLSYNRLNQSMTPVFDLAATNDIATLINRPLAMGALADPKDKTVALKQAFEFVRHACPGGTILTGTKSLGHLKQNLTALGFWDS